MCVAIYLATAPDDRMARLWDADGNRDRCLESPDRGTIGRSGANRDYRMFTYNRAPIVAIADFDNFG